MLIVFTLILKVNGKDWCDSLTRVVTSCKQIISWNVCSEWTAHVIVSTSAERHGEIGVQLIFQIVTRDANSVCPIQVYTEIAKKVATKEWEQIEIFIHLKLCNRNIMITSRPISSQIETLEAIVSVWLLWYIRTA